MPKFQTFDETYAHLVEKAQSDDRFRAALLADPRATVAAELGETLPADLTITVVEQPAKGFVLVLPRPAIEDLSDADLDAVAGGTSFMDVVNYAGSLLYSQGFKGGSTSGSTSGSTGEHHGGVHGGGRRH